MARCTDSAVRSSSRAGQTCADSELRDRFLGRGIERADVLDVVAEPLRAPRAVAIHAEHVDDAATDGEIARGRHRALAPVAELDEAGDETIARQPLATLDLGDARADDRRREGRAQQAAGDATTTSGVALACSRMNVARRARVTSSDGGTRSNGGVSPAGKIATPEPPAQTIESRVDALGLRRHDEHGAAGPLAQPPGDHADGAGRHAGDDAAAAPWPARRARAAGRAARGASAQRPPSGVGTASQSAPARFQTFMAASTPSRMIATAMLAARVDGGLDLRAFIRMERVEHVLDEVVAVAVPADADADAGKGVGAPGVDERLHAAMTGGAAAELDLHAPEREVRLVVDDDDVPRRACRACS